MYNTIVYHIKLLYTLKGKLFTFCELIIISWKLWQFNCLLRKNNFKIIVIDFKMKLFYVKHWKQVIAEPFEKDFFNFHNYLIRFHIHFKPEFWFCRTKFCNSYEGERRRDKINGYFSYFYKQYYFRFFIVNYWLYNIVF